MWIRLILAGVGGVIAAIGFADTINDVANTNLTPSGWAIAGYIGLAVFFGVIIQKIWQDNKELKKKIANDIETAKNEAKQNILGNYRKPFLKILPNILSAIEKIMRNTAENKIERYKITKTELSHRTGKYRKLVEDNKEYQNCIDKLIKTRHAISDRTLDNNINIY